MKPLKAKDLPEILSAEVIEILVKMLHDFSKIDMASWTEIVKVLRKRGQLEIVLNEYDKSVREMKIESDKKKTEKELLNKQKELDDFNIKKKKFSGNIGEPITPQDYKNKYGIWPQGFEENNDEVEK